MPKLSAAALKAKIATLQKQLEAAEKNKAPAIKKIVALMKKLGVTIADLQSAGTAVGAPRKGRRGRPAGSGNKAKVSGKRKRAGKKVAIKYRDDKGNTWTGRGKTPRWLTDAEKSGKSRDQFKI